MVDTISTAHRSWNMSRIKGKDTRPEIALRSLLHKLGYRFRLHGAQLPGKPDIVLPKYRTVVFVNGCFWHRHPGCSKAYTPKSRIEFWEAKFAGTIERDHRKRQELERLGWSVLTVWECELQRDPGHVLKIFQSQLREAA